VILVVGGEGRDGGVVEQRGPALVRLGLDQLHAQVMDTR
jgi:hypothetical protein